MHELRIIQDIFPLLEKVAKDNNLKKINKVVLGIGELRQVKSEFLEFAFETLAKDTIAAGAKLVINFIPTTVLCRNCNKQFTVKGNVYICPDCKCVDLEVLAGKEIVLESVDGVSSSS